LGGKRHERIESYRSGIAHCWFVHFFIIRARRILASAILGRGSGRDGQCSELHGEAALDAALAGGGSVTFNCGPNPATITVTSTKTIDADTAIDGSGPPSTVGGFVVTISGGGQVRIFVVNPKVTLTLDHITISHGAGTDSGGAIIVNVGGTLLVSNSTFSHNTVTMIDAESFGGGAIFNDEGTMSIGNSTFSRNHSIGHGQEGNVGGGAISNKGAANSTQTIADSTFFKNGSDASGGAIANFSPLVSDASDGLAVIDSTFTGNHAGAVGSGGMVVRFTTTAA
jgi:hypothetical protein